jgi:hypothetical protein
MDSQTYNTVLLPYLSKKIPYNTAEMVRTRLRKKERRRAVPVSFVASWKILLE